MLCLVFEKGLSGNDGRLRQPMIYILIDLIIHLLQKIKEWILPLGGAIIFDQLDIAISHFSGTSREPRFIR